MTKYNSDFQKKFLFNKLLEINKQLPFNVYLPFLRESTRNYIICHIPLSGVKILGNGKLEKKLTIKAHRFTKSAQAKIEAKGGKAEVI